MWANYEEVSELRIALSDDEHNDQVFYLGYSPERMNPGDPDRKIVDIVKLTSGSTKMAAELIDLVYKKIVAANTKLRLFKWQKHQKLLKTFKEM